MGGDDSKDRACLEALKQLRLLIAADYAEGGWLPPGRELCERFGVSHLTCRKALGHLVEERAARSYPRKGLYLLPEPLRPHKVGIVFRNGGDSQLICFLSELAAVFRVMGAANYMIHHIQASSLAGVPGKAWLRNVDGLFWDEPPAAARPVIKAVCEEDVLPLVVMGVPDPACPEDDFGDLGNHVGLDYAKLGRDRADFFLSRGHRRVAYVGPRWFAERIGFGAALRQAGVPFGPEQCAERLDEIAGLLAEGGFTGLSTEGGIDRAEMVFKVVSDLPEAKRPELLARYCGPALLDYHRKYPGVKLLGLEVTADGMIGAAAARMMLRRLQSGEPMAPLRMPASSIRTDVEGYIKESLG